MDYSYLFRSAKIKTESLYDAGFTTSDGENFTMRPTVSNGDFIADISLSVREQNLTVHLFDSLTGEKYPLFDMPNVHGAFVSSLREEVQKIVEKIKSQCFETHDLKDAYVDFLNARFSALPDFPWPETPDACVFRCENQKWFALIMKIKYRQIGLTSDEEVFVVNLKAESEIIPEIIDRKSIFPAWHMNKKHWITVLLTAATDFDKLCALTEKSHNQIEQKSKRQSRKK